MTNSWLKRWGTLLVLVGLALFPALGAVWAAPAADITKLAISVDGTSKSGQPGTAVQYTFTLTNSDTNPITANVAAVQNGGIDMSPNLSAASVEVPAGGNASVVLYLTIPADASSGQNSVVAVTFTNGSESQSFNLNTSVAAPVQPTSASPLVVLRSYDAGGSIQPGNSFTLSVTLANVGAGPANNMMVTFSSSDFLPTSNGGVQAVSSLKGGKSVELSQPMLASENLAGQSVASLTVKVDYTDSAGTARSDSFVITINLAAPSYVSSGPLPTATPMARPQLVISTYKTSVEPLQPGTIFNLKIDLKNLGSADARAVTMVLGGGGSTAGADGTPQAGGGISGSGGDLTNFAPLGSSNLVYLGDVPTGGTLSANPQLIVNVTTNPSAYPLKISFVYTDSKGNRQVDDQVITLLVYSLPQVEVSFYRDAGPFSVGQPAPLPLQVTNLGRKTAVLGNMHVSSDNGDVTNNVSLVGVLDPGGYYTLDANLLPAQAGPAHIKIIINYTDDFNQPRTVEQEITVNVDEAQVMPTPMSGGGGPGDAALQQPETAGHWFVRLLKGLFGLDNALPGTATPTPENTTPVHMPGGKGG